MPPAAAETERLGSVQGASADIGRHVVVRGDDGAVTLLVDEIGDVQEVDAEAFERPPETLRGRVRELIVGTYKLADRLLLVLDTTQALQLQTA